MLTSSGSTIGKCDHVLFVDRASELRYASRLSDWSSDVCSSDLPNHTHVEKCGDDLCVAEKFQSSSEIAGSPRNSFRASLKGRYAGVEH